MARQPNRYALTDLRTGELIDLPPRTRIKPVKSRPKKYKRLDDRILNHWAFLTGVCCLGMWITTIG